MAISLKKKAAEKSTFIVEVSFFDEAEQAVTPNTVTYSLRDEDGNIVNDREDVPLTPGLTVDIVLSGADLDVTTYGTRRALTVMATYDSTLGSDLPLNDEIYFSIQDLRGIS